MDADAASTLLNKLRQRSDNSTIDEAKNWLDRNSNDAAAIDILKEIEYRTSNAEDVRWCARWLQNHTDTTELEKALGKDSHLRVLLEEERAQAKLGPESGRQLDMLIDLVVSDSILALTRKWLIDFPDSDYADFVLLNLLRANPSKQHIGLAQEWLSRNPAEFTSDLVLSKLIEYGEVNDHLLTQALQSLNKSDEVAYTSELACTVVKSSTNKAARNSALEWCKEALRGKQAHIVASMIDTALPNDDLAPLVLDWCIKHPTDKWIGNTWNALLLNAPGQKVFGACWEWLERETKHEQWEDVFWFLLHAAAESREALPPAAINRAWDLWEKGNRRLVGVLLEADRSETVAENLFSWLRSNPNETKTANTILSALLQVSPTKQVIEYSADWIKSKGEHSFESLAVLRPLMAQAPDADLISITQDLLRKAREPQLNWSILELLIRTVKEPLAIARAKQLLNIEATLGFRRSLAYSCGVLFLALFGCRDMTPSLEACADQWLHWHSHKYTELAESLRAHLHTEDTD